MSVTRGQCDARPTVTFPAAKHHRPLAGNKLYCLVTEAHAVHQSVTCVMSDICSTDKQVIAITSTLEGTVLNY